MIKQYLLNNLKFVIEYDDNRIGEVVAGYKVQVED